MEKRDIVVPALKRWAIFKGATASRKVQIPNTKLQIMPVSVDAYYFIPARPVSAVESARAFPVAAPRVVLSKMHHTVRSSAA